MKLESFESWLILNTDYEVRDSKRFNKDCKDFILDNGQRVFISDDKLEISTVVYLVAYFNGKSSFSTGSHSRNTLTNREAEMLRVITELVLAYNAYNAGEANG